MPKSEQSKRYVEAARKLGAKAEEPDDFATGSGAPVHADRSLERAIGAQVRLLRRAHDLSVSDLASAASISTGMLSKIENGQISPSLSTIQAIAAALAVPITNLFAAFEERRDCSFVRADQGVVIERRGTKVGHVYQLLGHALGGDIVVEPFLITLQKDAVPYTSFRHAGVEFIYMLTGEVVYRHGEQTYRLRPGDALLFDSSAMHGPELLVERPMTYLSIIIYPRNPP
jgi:transcriptional regulator with XRE-family HTH domain